MKYLIIFLIIFAAVVAFIIFKDKGNDKTPELTAPFESIYPDSKYYNPNDPRNFNPGK